MIIYKESKSKKKFFFFFLGGGGGGGGEWEGWGQGGARVSEFFFY